MNYKKNILVALLVGFSNSCFSDEVGLQTFDIIDPKICSSIKADISSLLLESKAMRGKSRKVFTGSVRKPKRSDYYLYVQAYDFDGDEVDDLIATDWRGAGGKKFYLGYYVFSGKGDLFNDRKSLKKFFLETKLQERHGIGVLPIFSRNIYLSNNGEEPEYISFVAFHTIEAFEFKGNIYVYAEKDIRKMKMIFDIKNSLYCSIN